MAMDNIAGKMDTLIVDSLAKARRMGKDIGLRARMRNATSILEPTKMIRNMGMENLLGVQGVDTKGNI